jgi:hypothetical protein
VGRSLPPQCLEAQAAHADQLTQDGIMAGYRWYRVCQGDEANCDIASPVRNDLPRTSKKHRRFDLDLDL